MFDAGVDSPLGELLPLVRSMVGRVDVGELEVPDAVRVVEECAEAERLFATLASCGGRHVGEQGRVAPRRVLVVGGVDGVEDGDGRRAGYCQSGNGGVARGSSGFGGGVS